MSWSLRVSQGDLTVEGGKLGTVTSENKLLQDLRHYLLERMGSDPMYPSYGSLIDGGRLPGGQEVPSPIGSHDFQSVALELESEIRRVAGEYQTNQVNRAKTDRRRYNRVTLSAGEILVAINFIRFEQRQDTLLVHVGIETGTSRELNITLPLAPVFTN